METYGLGETEIKYRESFSEKTLIEKFLLKEDIGEDNLEMITAGCPCATAIDQGINDACCDIVTGIPCD